jgi:hypothetical protein
VKNLGASGASGLQTGSLCRPHQVRDTIPISGRGALRYVKHARLSRTAGASGLLGDVHRNPYGRAAPALVYLLHYDERCGLLRGYGVVAARSLRPPISCDSIIAES